MFLYLYFVRSRVLLNSLIFFVIQMFSSKKVKAQKRRAKKVRRSGADSDHKKLVKLFTVPEMTCFALHYSFPLCK